MSEGCRDLRPLLGAYVLGALEPDEAALVRAHVASCPACAAEHSRLAPLPGLLTLAEGATRAVEEPLPPALEERLLDAVAAGAPPRPRARRRWAAWRRAGLLGVAFTAAAAAVVVAVVLATSGTGDHIPGYGPEIPLRATATPASATGYAELRTVAGGTALHLHVTGLPADPAAVYEVHCDSPDWSASAGTFRVDANGEATVVLTTAARRGQYDHIRVLRRTSGTPRVVLDAALS